MGMYFWGENSNGGGAVWKRKRVRRTDLLRGGKEQSEKEQTWSTCEKVECKKNKKRGGGGILNRGRPPRGG